MTSFCLEINLDFLSQHIKKNLVVLEFYLSMTIMPSNTLNPLDIYLNGPSATILRSISTANIAENTMLLISTITVSSSG